MEIKCRRDPISLGRGGKGVGSRKVEPAAGCGWCVEECSSHGKIGQLSRVGDARFQAEVSGKGG
jgi:hypothetical protein